MKKILMIFLAVQVLTSGSLAAAAGSRVDLVEEIVHYEFEAVPGSNVREAMIAASPLESHGIKSVGRTSRVLHFDIDYEKSTKGCKIKNWHTTVKTTYTMPKWINYQLAPPRLRAEWDRFYSALLIHEKKHGENTVRMAERIVGEVLLLGYQNKCSLAARRGKEISEQIVKEDQWDEDFDKRTMHGYKEGTFLNIPEDTFFRHLKRKLFYKNY